ncbi:UDP-4-amino-4,6-dideoxy-N-acetyl-beta-L-altrosamine N-acetyltransferase [Halobacillus sp. A1]|uniref:UDP-4-amino-4, 6-dideoxy-N-acetyl-beta-L-altrosamine N-acetyltransferase n=1 Tax=Halobacillus sp. A1 TaxID=2880262 RepID=UPI0020A63AA1|nr:UDP-4-amino-4,6-dideoxy-N-acetyl-beta-L-altrosamine N-acetyltransferase [Halobacillus sp. A1]MCP3029962.1 UDP-4-amino-4,6-dideoxy-N-acetyl-beta-L-altrosamine N-acetyltransferase [Halobacillus sp. A1]
MAADLHRYTLKNVEKSNLNLILTWRNSPVIKEAMYSDHEITMEEHLAWYKKIEEQKSVIAKLFIHDETPLGLVNFSNIDTRNNKCMWGFYIGADPAPRGAGTALGILALDYIFDKKGFRKVCAEVLEANSRSLNFHKKMGFQEEGRFQKHVWKTERFMDVIPMRIFKDEWPHVKQRLLGEMGGKEA